MVSNYSLKKMSVFLIMMLIMPWYIDAMEAKVLSENEVAKIRAQFELGQMWALGEDGDKDYGQARECFGDVIKADIDKEASAWSYLWLSKIRLNDGDEAEEYLVKARSYGKDVAFISELADFLKESSDGKLEKEKSKEIFFDGVKKGSTRVLKFLLSCGVEVDFSTYLHCAAQYGHKGIVELLLEAGCDIETKVENDYTPLLRAAQYNHKDVVELLLEKGADIETKNKNGLTALYICALENRKNIVKLLLEAGADTEVKDQWGARVLYWAARRGHRDVVELLLEAGADIDGRSGYGATALHGAVRSMVFLGNECVFDLLLGKGADIEARDEGGNTVLLIASEAVSKATVESLKKDAAIGGDNGISSMALAALENRKNIVRFLLRSGADIKAKNNDGNTALHLAAMNGHKNIGDWLIEWGADIGVKNKNGKTPLDYMPALK